MDPTTRAKMVDAVAALASAFGRQADDPLYMAFELGLEGLSSKQINAAAARALQGSKFMPTPAELRELAGELTPKARAVIAWEFLSKAAASGFYTTVDFDDPVINAAVRNIGGWEYVTTIEDPREWESFVRPKFEAAYVALYQHGISSEQGSPLLGFHDRENAKGGYAMQEPLRIHTTLPAGQVRIQDSSSRRGLPADGVPLRIGQQLAASLSVPKDS